MDAEKILISSMNRLEDLYGCLYTIPEQEAWVREVQPKITSEGLMERAVQLLKDTEDPEFMRKPAPIHMLKYIKRARVNMAERITIKPLYETVKQTNPIHIKALQELAFQVDRISKDEYSRKLEAINQTYKTGEVI